jgi:hypothetical protein
MRASVSYQQQSWNGEKAVVFGIFAWREKHATPSPDALVAV